MITEISIILAMLIAIIIKQLRREAWHDNLFADIVLILGGVLLLFNTIAILLSGSFEYNNRKAERDEIQRTLDYARENTSEGELYAITQSVVEFNKSLSVTKKQNKTLFLDQYIDDRFEDMKPIK